MALASTVGIISLGPITSAFSHLMLSLVTCLPCVSSSSSCFYTLKLAFVSEKAGFSAGSRFTLQVAGWNEVEHLSWRGVLGHWSNVGRCTCSNYMLFPLNKLFLMTYDISHLYTRNKCVFYKKKGHERVGRFGAQAHLHPVRKKIVKTTKQIQKIPFFLCGRQFDA